MDLETLRVSVTLATTLGVGTILPAAALRVFWLLTGGTAKVRSEVDKAQGYVEKTRRQTGKDARRTRKVEECASLLRRRLIAADCVDASMIPPWPNNTPDTDSTPRGSNPHVPRL